MEYLWVGMGGFVGANARFALGRLAVERFGTGFPVGTLAINVSGSILIGILLTLLTQRAVPNDIWRLLLVVGFLGGYTTFSSYSFEAVALIEDGLLGRAAWYVIGGNALGLLGCYGGMIVARGFSR